MRTVGAVGSLLTLSANDHICWPYDDVTSFRSSLIEFLGAGIARGLRVAYAGSGDPVSLKAGLEGLADVDRLLAGGRLEIVALEVVYGSKPIADLDAAAAAFAAATERALADGYLGFRLGADVTEMVRSPAQRDSFVRYECQVDRFASANPFSAMCAYDAQLGPAVLAELASVHPIAPAALTPFHVFTTPEGAIGLSGEVDIASAAQFRRTLDRIRVTPEAAAVVWDLSAVTFIDHRALLAMDAMADRLGLPALVPDPPRFVRRLARLISLDHVEIVDVEPAS
ncbi:MEDS domain-containing protein [Pseudonocardia zijingensis]|jgi:anti-anti-sigma regulatory factor|uniref:STAS domain-containing protein n=1 Tax=Pseudonocardia zijingensis TaxID=153376 RepID=A0ABP3ZEZ8_9PSEU